MQYRGHPRVTIRPDGQISVVLTDGQTEPLGYIVQHLYYTNIALCDIIPHCGGYPHNGGEHTMYMHGSKSDVLAFLQLAAEYYTRYAIDRPRYVAGAEMLRHLTKEVMSL